jgi:long-chain acyl-CoA synthetase
MIADLVRQWADRAGTSPAWVAADGSEIDWQSLQVQVASLVTRLVELGLQPGDVVVTRFPNGFDSILHSLAINKLQATESPVDPRLDRSFVDLAVKTLDAAAVIDPLGCSLQDRAALGRESSRASGAQSALIMWTSGTTRRPRAVPLGWDQVLGNARGKLSAVPQTAADRRLTVLPLSHAFARTCDFATWLLTGGTLAAGDGWEAVRALGPVVRPTVINLVPYLIDKIFCGCDQQADLETLAKLGLRHLRVLGCGGAPLTPERFNRIHQLGIIPIQGYGLTETGPVICSASPRDARPGVVGRPIPGTKIRIGPSDEIQVRGPGVMAGYWRDPAATAARWTNDGWFRTGDSGRIEADGMLAVCGRLDEVIVLASGRKVWPVERERRLATVEGVRHVVLRGCGVGLEAIVDLVSGVDRDRVWQAIERLNHSRRNEPRVIKMTVTPTAWSVETGELTAKGTVRRGAVLRRLNTGWQSAEDFSQNQNI